MSIYTSLIKTKLKRRQALHLLWSCEVRAEEVSNWLLSLASTCHGG